MKKCFGIFMLIRVKRLAFVFLFIWLMTSVCVCSLGAKEMTAGSNEKDKNEEKKEAEELQLFAKAAVLMDAENGRVLYGKNENEVLANASTTKILTAIVVLEQCDLNEEVQISKHAATRPKVRLGMHEGEVYTVQDLLYAMLLQSCNDCACALAEHAGGDEEGFSKLLNDKAKQLGCEDTFFITPNGLDAERDGRMHATSAKDLARITRYALANEQFCQIIQTGEYSFCDSSKKNCHTVRNTNRFLSMSEYAIGVKTGFTNRAGYCFVGASKCEDRTLISVVLASGWPPHKDWKWQDTKLLMEYGQKQYQQKDIYREIPQMRIDILDGIETSATVTQERKEMKLLLSKEDRVTTKINMDEKLKAPVERGQIVGSVQYFVNGELFDETKLYTLNGSEAFSFFYCFKNLFQNYCL